MIIHFACTPRIVALAALILIAAWTSSAQASAIRDLPGLTLVRVYEKTTNVFNHDYAPNDNRLLVRLANLTSTSDFTGTPTEKYDVFYSNADGSPNVDGAYLTIEGIFPSSGGFNITAARLSFGATHEFADSISTFTYGTNPSVGSEVNAIDGDINTNTTFGTAANDNRMAITLGFASSVPEPATACLLAAGLPMLIRRRR